MFLLTFESSNLVDADVFAKSRILAVLKAFINIVTHFHTVSHEAWFAETRVRAICVLAAGSWVALVRLFGAFVDV